MRSLFPYYVTCTLLTTVSRVINHHTLSQKHSHEEKSYYWNRCWGTNTVFGFVDEGGQCVYESSILTHSNQDADQLFNSLFKKIYDDFKKYSVDYELSGIGIGAPNANYYKGTVEFLPNLNWGIVNVLEIVKKYSPLPSAITNDANAAAIGEMIFGAAKGMKDFIVITLGTGLGSGIVVNSELVYGADGFAGEIGHTIQKH